MTDYTTFQAPLAHPGEHLREDYLPAYKLTPGRPGCATWALKRPHPH